MIAGRPLFDELLPPRNSVRPTCELFGWSITTQVGPQPSGSYVRISGRLWPTLRWQSSNVGSTSVPGLAAKPVIDISVYGNLKNRLAETFPHDIDGYAHGKTDLILDILRKAGLSAAQLQSIEMTNRKPSGATDSYK
jgi:hypothetical protein